MKCIEKFAYGVGHTSNDLCSAIWFTYVLIFYELALEFPTLYSGLVMLVGQIADAVATPIIGVLCDRGPTFWKINLRKRKIWYLFGSILVLMTCPFLYSECYAFNKYSMMKRFFYYIIIAVLFQIAWACVQIAHLAMAPDLTPDDHERTNLMSLRNTFTVLSNLFVYFLTFVILKFKSDDDDDNKKAAKVSPKDIGKFQLVVIICLSIGTIGSALFYIFVKENTDRLDADSVKSVKRTTFKEMFCRVSLYQVILIYTGSRLFCNVTQALIPLYLNITLLMDKPTIASLPFVMYSSSFIASLLSACLNDAIGRKLTFLIGSLLAFGASLWIRIDSTNFYKHYFIYIVIIFIGFSSSLLLVTALAVTNDHIGDDINNAAFLYGILSFADKLSCGIIIMLIQALEKYYGPMYYRNVLSYLCASSAGIGLLCIFTMQKENQNQVEKSEDKENVKKSRPMRIIGNRSSI